MAELIAYPKIGEANLIEWRVMIQDLEIFTGGLLLIDVENINNNLAPRIKASSLLEAKLDINGSRYKCTSTEGMANGAANNAQNYIYARANGNTASFLYGTEEPQWNPAKGGWYNGNDRAVVKLFVTGGQYNNKVILDSYNAMFAVNTKQLLSNITAAGVAVFNHSNTIGEWEHDLAPGMYKYSVKGGHGGAGGDGGAAGTPGSPSLVADPGDTGNPGGNSTEVTGIFLWQGGRIKVKVGANGGKGGDTNNSAAGLPAAGASDYRYAGNGGPGGGGGGGIDSNIGEIVAPGGSPGRGTKGKRKVNHASYGGIPFSGSSQGGSYGIGGTGGHGASACSRDATLTAMGYAGEPGEPGGGPGNSTNGHAKLWRVG
jgi:hypothetical protein